MIGRTLDAMLSPFQIIGKECRRAGEDSIFLYLADAVRNTILPVEKCSYHTYRDNDEDKTVLSEDNWSIYFSDEWELKRECAKAFEQRRKAKTGESFDLSGKAHTGFGTFDKKFGVKRIGKNAVVYRGHLIASDEKTLLENKDKGYTPVFYRGVIW